MIEFKTLGPIELSDTATGASLQSVLAQPKRIALLAYLAVKGTRNRVRRDQLLALFWPDSVDARGRAAFSQALYVLRRSLGDDVIITQGDEEVGLADDKFWCDVVAFSKAIADGQPRRALELYGGDFLAGFHVADAHEFDEWLEQERRSLRARAAGAAWALVEEQERAHNYAQAAHFARYALTLQPYDEGALQRALLVLERAQDRAGAIHEAESFRKRLREDLDLEISAETQARITAMRQQHHSSAIEEPLAELSARTQPRVPLPWIGAMATLALTAAAAIALRPDEAPLVANRVVVAEFVNESNDAALHSLGRIAADWIAQGLGHTGLVEVVPAVTTLRSEHAQRAAHQTPLTTQELAREMGAGVVVAGSYFQQGDSIFLQARIVDGETGQLVRGLGRTAASRENPMAAIEQLRQRALGAFGELNDRRLNAWARVASQPPSFEAYQAYADGLTHFFRATPEGQTEATRHFRRAAAYDSSFTAPLLWAIFAYKNLHQRAQADTLARQLEQVRDQLAAWDRAVLDMHQADLRGDARDAYEHAKQVASLTPASEWRFLVASHAMALGRPREALSILLRMDPERGWIRTWPPYWNVRIGARHLLGQNRVALQEIEDALKAHPNDRFLPLQQLRLLVGVGRVDEAEAAAAALSTRADSKWDAVEPFVVVANEMAAHGHSAEARRVALRASKMPIGERAGRMRGPSARAYLLLAAGEIQQAHQVASRLVRSDSSFSARGLYGLTAAGIGDTATAHRMSAAVAAGRPNYSHGSKTYWRAAIAAYLGEHQRAVSLLRQAVHEGHRMEIVTHASPTLLPLRNYEPFRQLIAGN